MSPGPDAARSTAPDAAPVRVLVVDDHPIWRDGTARYLAEAGFTVAGTAGSGAQALRIAAAVAPDVVLLDLNLPDLPAAEVIRGLLAAVPATRVLMLSASGERQDVLDAVTAGALGYMLKSARVDEIVAAVRTAAIGQPVFTPGLAGLVLGEYRRLADGGRPTAGQAAAAEPGPRDRAARPAADRPRDGDTPADRQGPDLPADRRPAHPVHSHRAEPRPQHPDQAATAQQGGARPLRPRERSRLKTPTATLLLG